MLKESRLLGIEALDLAEYTSIDGIAFAKEMTF
jgi:hypothetical protein